MGPSVSSLAESVPTYVVSKSTINYSSDTEYEYVYRDMNGGDMKFSSIVILS